MAAENDKGRLSGLRRITAWLILLTTVGAVAGWRFYCPEFGDDLGYNLVLPDVVSDNMLPPDWTEGALELTDLRDVPHTFYIQFVHFSGRVANLVYILLRMTPPAAERAVTAAVILAMFFGLTAVAYPADRRFRPGRLALAVLAFWLLLPWDDYMQSGAFVFNYPFPAALMLLFIRLYRRKDVGGGWGKAALFAVATVLAPMHEAFSVCVLAWLVADCVARRRLTAGSIGLMLVFVCGILVVLGFGSFWRLDASVASRVSPFAWLRFSVPVLVRLVLPVALAIALMWLCRWSSPGQWIRLRTTVYPYLAPLAAVLVMVCGIGQFIPRGAWAADVFIILIVLSCSDAILEAHPVRQWVATVAAGGFSLLYLGWAFALIDAQREAHRVDSDLIAALSPRFSSASNVLFSPECRRVPGAVWLLGMAEPAYFAAPEYSGDIGVHYLKNHSNLCLVPEEWRGLPVAEWPEIPGSAGALDLYPMLVLDYPYKGRLRLEAGEFLESARWTNRVLREVKKRTIGDADGYVFEVWGMRPVVMPDSSVKYCVRVIAPETFSQRKILQIDTLGNNLNKSQTTDRGAAR